MASTAPNRRLHGHAATRRIEFSETDLAGVVHFSRFFVLMESAEDEFLHALGASFTTDPDGNAWGWPKVSASCDYRRPVRYGDRVDIVLRVAARSARTITYEFSFRRDGEEVARGRTVSACCVRRPDGSYQAVPIPASLADRIETAR